MSYKNTKTQNKSNTNIYGCLINHKRLYEQFKPFKPIVGDKSAYKEVNNDRN